MIANREQRLATLASPKAAFRAHLAFTSLGLCFLVWINRHQGFLAEDWVYFGRNHPELVHGDVLRWLFEQYRGHWITTTNLVFEGAYRLVGLRSYWPYLLPTLMATSGCAVLLRVVMRRAGVTPWIATAASGIALVVAAGAENEARAFQFSFTSALFFGLALLLLTDHDGPVDRRDVIGVTAGFLALMSSGIGLILVFVAALSFALRRRWRALAIDVVPLAIVFGTWYLAYGHEWGSQERMPLGATGTLLSDVWHALGRTLEEVTRFDGAGAVLVLGLIGGSVALGISFRAARMSAVAALAVGVPVFFLLSGFSSVGAVGRLPDRYLQVSCILVLPLVAVLLTQLLAHHAQLRAVVAVGLICMLVANATLLYVRTMDYVDLKDTLETKVLAMASLPELASLPRSSHLSEPVISGITAGLLLDLRRDGAFGNELKTVDPGTRFDVATELLVTFDPGSITVGVSNFHVVTTKGVGLGSDAAGCLTAEATTEDAQIVLEGNGPSQLGLRTSFGGSLAVSVSDLGTGLQSQRTFPLVPEQAGELQVRIQRGLRLTLGIPERGQTTICGAGK